MPVLERMAKIGLPLCVHGEVTTPEVDIFDREAVFIETVLEPLRARLPELKVTMEHVTTKDGIDYIKASKSNLAGSITTHHLIINRNAILVGGIRPHYYCLPVAKRELHRLALRAAAISGDGRFFLGTDSAPHVDPLKECACGCAGIYTSINTMSCLAHVFEQENALDKLEAFTSLNGPAWYGLPVNDETITPAQTGGGCDISGKDRDRSRHGDGVRSDVSAALGRFRRWPKPAPRKPALSRQDLSFELQML